MERSGVDLRRPCPGRLLTGRLLVRVQPGEFKPALG
jgi:hypothetical protein